MRSSIGFSPRIIAGVSSGVATGAVYVPFEATAFLRHPGPEPMVALVLNVAIVLLLARQLRHPTR